MSFKDHFSDHADRYARYRPGYPPELFEYLATLTPRRKFALDCATGNGQAAAGLADHFERVIATDASLSQLQHARSHPKIMYVCNLAEQPAFGDRSIDLMVAAQAAHWFDFDRFYAQARRVLRAEGALAVWTYGLARVEPRIDAAAQDFYRDVVGPYWPPERRFIEAAYRDLPFAMREEPTPVLQLEMSWDMETFIGYVGTWSAVQRYTKATGSDPLPQLREKLTRVWNSPSTERSVVWPLHIRVGRPD